MSHRTGKIEILGVWEDGRMLFKYHQAKYDADRGRIFAVKLGENQTWLPGRPLRRGRGLTTGHDCDNLKLIGRRAGQTFINV